MGRLAIVEAIVALAEPSKDAVPVTSPEMLMVRGVVSLAAEVAVEAFPTNEVAVRVPPAFQVGAPVESLSGVMPPASMVLVMLLAAMPPADCGTHAGVALAEEA